MADQTLDFRIIHRRRKVAEIQLPAALLDDAAGLQKVMRDWLKADGWDKGRWPEFTGEVRLRGRGRVETTVRA